MLQQTQVATVIPYYEKFMDRFHSVSDLAEADIDQILHLWTGLGYYARARNLHKTARRVVEEYKSKFPESVDALEDLPGIGRSTAGAIAALSMGKRAVILDGNVKRVLARFFAVEGWPGQTKTKENLWELAEQQTPTKNVAGYTQAIMDLGATVCKRSNPKCHLCPIKEDCAALISNTIKNFPGKQPKKSLPNKSVVMYILRNERREVLLEKRPPTGIWGSLYSLPEGQKGEKNNNIERMLTGAKLEQETRKREHRVEPLKHTFSHFRLSITPKVIEVLKNQCEINDSNRWLWYPLDHSLEVGLAAPVKKLLFQLSQFEN
jgi:A/G-specific adenine glycosylase